jgi:hypothetical protein
MRSLGKQGMTLSAFVPHESHHRAIPSRTIVRLFFSYGGIPVRATKGPPRPVASVLQLVLTCSHLYGGAASALTHGFIGFLPIVCILDRRILPSSPWRPNNLFAPGDFAHTAHQDASRDRWGLKRAARFHLHYLCVEIEPSSTRSGRTT